MPDPSAPAGSLARRATAADPGVRESSWLDHELVRGYGVMVLPFTSGHLLALRVWRQSSFGPYVSVWHRPPTGRWSIYSDGPSVETTCPRYWGPITDRAELSRIQVTWTGPADLRIEMDDPRLRWTLSASTPRRRRALNAVSAALPRWSWQVPAVRRFRAWVARRVLDLGDLEFAFTVPSGHDTVIMPAEIYEIPESTAILAGRSLGDPVGLETTPTIGGVPLPKRPSFVVGEAHMRITDREAYRRTRRQVLDDGAVAAKA